MALILTHVVAVFQDYPYKCKNSKLDTVLEIASELSYSYYNWQKEKDKETLKSYQMSLKKVKEYFKQNKEVLKGIL